MKILVYIVVFVLGSCVGSFLNVLIFRIPKHEEFVTGRSHCMSCGHPLAWYDMFPVFSFIFLGGKCRYCGAKLSKQYPLIEALNGALWCICFARYDITAMGILTAALISALIVMAVIDERTQEIPFGINVFIAVLGIIKVVLEIISTGDDSFALEGISADEYSPLEDIASQTVTVPHILLTHLTGFAVVAGVLLIIILIAREGTMGGGDMKLMAAAGLFLGLRLTIIAFFLGCVIGTVIHLIRMAFFHAGRQLAFGPYLAVSIGLMAVFGNDLLRAYVASII